MSLRALNTLRLSTSSLSHLYLDAYRSIQHAVLPSHPPSTYPEPPIVYNSHGRRRRRHVLKMPSPPASELARRVEALTVISENEGTPSDNMYSEQELLAFYEDLLSPPDNGPAHPFSLPAESSRELEDKVAVEAILSRLSPPHFPSVSSETFSDLLQRRAEPTSSPDSSKTQPHSQESRSSLPHHVTLDLLGPIIQQLESSQSIHASSSGESSLPMKDVPLAILSVDEWKSLTRLCLTHDDPHSAKTALRLMKASGMDIVEDHADDVLRWYARRGDVLGLEEFLQTFVQGPLTDRQRHLHIEAHEKSVAPGTVPESALSLLHTYEKAGRPPPMTAYSRLIAALFRTPSSIAHAQAWDLFSHMRYVAHPQPDSLLFTQMIQACALPTPSEPERALDLFTEMTIDHRITPTAGAYNAAILACARSGSKVYVNEAFRLAKEMLDSHRDARGRGVFRPDSHTFDALLEGAKRIGDLGRVRWILAEMIETSRRDPESKDVVVDERIMTHVFHSYAAYKPPFRRSMAPLASQNEIDADTPRPARPSEPVESAADDYQLPAPIDPTERPSFTHLPPQSRSELIGEVRALFSRISRPSPLPTNSHSGHLPTFPDVHVTPRLLNAYLSVFYAHAPLETAHVMFRTAFVEHDLEKDARTLVEALERCAGARRGTERAYVMSFADDAWHEWTAFENSQRMTRARSIARHTQRAYAARIRVLALTGRLDEALACLNAFVARYPPNSVRDSSPSSVPTQLPAKMRSQRVSLVAGGRPLVRFMTALDVQDDDVPPLLTFADIEVLHHRLVAAGDLRNLAYVKWVCKSYEGALRKRREATLKLA